MTSSEIRKKFLVFFESKGHTIVPSSSLIPENDPSVLFTTAGMQQFKPYYAGDDAKKAFGSLNTTSVQKCIRTSDIDEVGDESHLTFFEMLGNFSFGGYFKEEAVKLAHEFVTKEMGLKIDFVSVFEGDKEILADAESEKIWKAVDPNIIVKKFGRADNFWGPTGDEGPCGPTTEIYVDGIEIWNIVFNEYFCRTRINANQNANQRELKILEPLAMKGIDTGMGLERLAKVVQKVQSVFETDLFKPLIDHLGVRPLSDPRATRIIADHLRSGIFLLADGVRPSNTDRGYILRRLLRRAARYAHLIEFEIGKLSDLVPVVAEIYKDIYPDIEKNKEQIKNEIEKEELKFRESLAKGLKQFEKIIKTESELPDHLIERLGAKAIAGTRTISGEDAFLLFATYGFPLELTLELAAEKGLNVNIEGFNGLLRKHQEVSRAGLEHKFKGGLADTDPKTIRLHTAHHLLLSALQEVLGKDIKQRGSNITQERLRMDFSFERKLADEEKRKVEEIVNQKIKAGLVVIKKEMLKDEAEKIGAQMEFGGKYGDVVSVYSIEDKNGDAFSIEFCGGPHVSNTSELGQFKILKEEAVAAGIRRIKAILE